MARFLLSAACSLFLARLVWGIKDWERKLLRQESSSSAISSPVLNIQVDKRASASLHNRSESLLHWGAIADARTSIDSFGYRRNHSSDLNVLKSNTSSLLNSTRPLPAPGGIRLLLVGLDSSASTVIGFRSAITFAIAEALHVPAWAIELQFRGAHGYVSAWKANVSCVEVTALIQTSRRGASNMSELCKQMTSSNATDLAKSIQRAVQNVRGIDSALALSETPLTLKDIFVFMLDNQGTPWWRYSSERVQGHLMLNMMHPSSVASNHGFELAITKTLKDWTGVPEVRVKIQCVTGCAKVGVFVEPFVTAKGTQETMSTGTKFVHESTMKKFRFLKMMRATQTVSVDVWFDQLDLSEVYRRRLARSMEEAAKNAMLSIYTLPQLPYRCLKATLLTDIATRQSVVIKLQVGTDKMSKREADVVIGIMMNITDETPTSPFLTSMMHEVRKIPNVDYIVENNASWSVVSASVVEDTSWDNGQQLMPLDMALLIASKGNQSSRSLGGLLVQSTLGQSKEIGIEAAHRFNEPQRGSLMELGDKAPNALDSHSEPSNFAKWYLRPKLKVYNENGTTVAINGTSSGLSMARNTIPDGYIAVMFRLGVDPYACEALREKMKHWDNTKFSASLLANYETIEEKDPTVNPFSAPLEGAQGVGLTGNEPPTCSDVTMAFVDGDVGMVVEMPGSTSYIFGSSELDVAQKAAEAVGFELGGSDPDLAHDTACRAAINAAFVQDIGYKHVIYEARFSQKMLGAGDAAEMRCAEYAKTLLRVQCVNDNDNIMKNRPLAKKSDGWGNNCDYYERTGSEACGKYDDVFFNATERCCICGGGAKPFSPSVLSVDPGWRPYDMRFRELDTDGNGMLSWSEFSRERLGYHCIDDLSVNDSWQNTCTYYTKSQDQVECGRFDDDDFSASYACCACGGGLKIDAKMAATLPEDYIWNGSADAASATLPVRQKMIQDAKHQAEANWEAAADKLASRLKLRTDESSVELSFALASLDRFDSLEFERRKLLTNTIVNLTKMTLGTAAKSVLVTYTAEKRGSYDGGQVGVHTFIATPDDDVAKHVEKIISTETFQDSLHEALIQKDFEMENLVVLASFVNATSDEASVLEDSGAVKADASDFGYEA